MRAPRNDRATLGESRADVGETILGANEKRAGRGLRRLPGEPSMRTTDVTNN